jgi:hypothetical protein
MALVEQKYPDPALPADIFSELRFLWEELARLGAQIDAAMTLVSSGIQVGGAGATGSIGINRGTVSQSGYVAIYSPAGVRQGYIGASTTNDTTDNGILVSQASRHEFVGMIRLRGVASDPSGPAAGDMYFNNTTFKHRGFDGTSWHDMY